MHKLSRQPDHTDHSEQADPQQPVSPVERALARRLAAASEAHRALREEHAQISQKAHQAAADAERLARELRDSAGAAARDVEQNRKRR